jgi:hypothetical protein
MTDRPMQFIDPMVRALLAGAKTQTRRVAKITAVMGNRVSITSPDEKLIELEPGEFQRGVFHYESTGALSGPYSTGYAVGDRLWVREAWRTESSAYDDLKGSEMDADYPVIYEVDADWKLNKSVGRYRHARFMPRWASRITLTVTDVRVQRVQDISDDDAIAEGAVSSTCANVQPPKDGFPSYRSGFSMLWESIYGPGSWATNPWIGALTFTVAKGNIDG